MHTLPRRDAIKVMGAAGAGALLGAGIGESTSAQDTFTVAGKAVEIALEAVSAQTLRVSLVPTGGATTIPQDGSLAQVAWNKPVARLGAQAAPSRDRQLGQQRIRAGNLTAIVTPDPLSIRIEATDGRVVQELRFDRESGAVTFPLGDAPVLGFGEGGPQFDRRGAVDRMRSGQGGYRLRTHGSRVPIPWLIGTSGWALYIHQPFGTFDLSGAEGRFTPAVPRGQSESASPPPNALPIDIFVVGTRDPVEVMAEWAKLTGLPELPPLWSFGYLQSHRTLSSHEEIVGVAKTFREKQLPCDALIYLGTGFTPSGWNVQNGSFAFNRNVFPDPKAVIDELHAQHFKVVLHSVILARTLRGVVNDTCDLGRYDEEEAGCYWHTHRKTLGLGVDGWWPDEGDALDITSRLVRNRMYWQGPQLDRPNQRPFALHRNGYAGMQRFASFLWSGDVFSTWETLKVHIPIAINTGLSGIPYWGTDIGGFVPTKEFTGELYVRWFQFGAFCPLFRSHGRTWKLRLPWGWNNGAASLEPLELNPATTEASNPDVSELHNAAVEPICKQYLELRYRLMPYLYSAVHETHLTGLPIMRALWLHYPDDATAVARGDEYLWGRDILVAPVVERGATTRKVYLPRGKWYDFWTQEAIDGGREIDRAVDLKTTPLYVRAGAIVPMGPLKQYTEERVTGPLTLTVYPGADGRFMVYEDDGRSFDHRTGGWMGLDLAWQDASRRLTVRLAKGSKILPPAQRPLTVRLAGTQTTKDAVFDGRELTIAL